LVRTVRVDVVKVDRETLRHFKFPLFVPEKASEEEMLKAAKGGCNVGDFLVLPSRKTFRRIRGGFRVATEEDMAELIGSQLYPFLEGLDEEEAYQDLCRLLGGRVSRL
jgi:hypothetical protein